MAKPTNPRDLHFILGQKEEENRKLKEEKSIIDFELTNSRKDINRLKNKIIELEDDVASYKADVSKWKTFCERVPQTGGTSDQQKRIDSLERQLGTALRDRDDATKQLLSQPHQPKDFPDAPRVQPQLETNKLRFTIDQRDNEIRKMLQDLKELQSSNSRLSEQLKMKDEEIDRLRRQLLDTSNYVLPPSSPPDHEVHKLKDINRRLSSGNETMTRQMRELEERNIHLHHQNDMYEDDYKKEKDDKKLFERRLIASQEQIRDLKAILEAQGLTVGEP